MKFIKSRNKFLNEEKEAKIRELILPRQAAAIKEKWGEKYLDYEEIIPTDKIKQGKWKLTDEDKDAVLGAFFQTNMTSVNRFFIGYLINFLEFLHK